jgi:hypothetical protein
MKSTQNIEQCEHPTFGVITVGRQISNRECLFGAVEAPGQCVSITISRAVLEHHRDSHRTHVYPANRLIEILLSPLQFAQLLTGTQDGSACTITWFEGKFHAGPEKPPTTRLAHLHHDFEAEMRQVGKGCDEFLEQARRLRDKTTVGKADRAAFVDLAEGLVAKITATTPHIASRMAEVIEQMKAELAMNETPTLQK